MSDRCFMLSVPRGIRRAHDNAVDAPGTHDGRDVLHNANNIRRALAGSRCSADLRGRVEQNNIQRRQLYTRRATERSVSVNEMAAAVACEVFQRPRIAVGEKYRNEAGQWRTRSAGAR